MIGYNRSRVRMIILLCQSGTADNSGFTTTYSYNIHVSLFIVTNIFLISTLNRPMPNAYGIFCRLYLYFIIIILLFYILFKKFERKP